MKLSLLCILLFYSCGTVSAADDLATNSVPTGSDNLTYELLRTYEPKDKLQQDQGHRSYYCVRTKGENPYFAACHIEDAAHVSNKIKISVREFPGIIVMGCIRACLKDQSDVQKFQEISDTFFDTFNPKEMHTAFNQSDQKLINYVTAQTQQFGGQRKSQLIKDLQSTHRPTSAAAFAELWSISLMARAEFWLVTSRYIHARVNQAKESAVFEFIPKERLSDEEQVQSGIMYPLTGRRMTPNSGVVWRLHGMRELNKVAVSNVNDITMLAYDLAVYAHQHSSILDLYNNRSHSCICVDFERAQEAVKESLTPDSYPEIYNKRETWWKEQKEKIE